MWHYQDNKEINDLNLELYRDQINDVMRRTSGKPGTDDSHGMIRFVKDPLFGLSRFFNWLADDSPVDTDPPRHPT